MEIQSSSPDQQFSLYVDVWEARNSLWVYSPQIRDARDGTCLLMFKDKHWSVERDVWLDNTRVALMLRKYPGNHYPVMFSVTVDCAELTAELSPLGFVALDALEAALESTLATD